MPVGTSLVPVVILLTNNAFLSVLTLFLGGGGLACAVPQPGILLCTPNSLLYNQQQVQPLSGSPPGFLPGGKTVTLLLDPCNTFLARTMAEAVFPCR